ncbi:MAG: hypothetical protein BV457_05625, partial [Thermoplasmata archaeon M9B1D]
MDLSILAPIGGIVSLIFAIILYISIKKENPGNEKMKELSKAIREGAMAFLKSEYKVLIIFVIVVALLLFIASLFFTQTQIHWGSSIAFLIGALFSAVSGNIGMRMATMANARTAEGAKKNLSKGLSIAFSSGAVMGMTVVGLGVLGLTFVFYLFNHLLPSSWVIIETGLDRTLITTNILFAFGFGASSIALFARVGGGIYTKSADVGADLVGKVEAGIPEDDPRNPAVIADQVGDNVGDVAGMGADLFESYVDSIIATMALGAIAGGFALPIYGINAVLLPLIIAGMGIFASIIGTIIVVFGKGKNVYGALRNSLFLATGLTAIFAGIVTWYLIDDLKPFYAMLAG